MNTKLKPTVATLAVIGIVALIPAGALGAKKAPPTKFEALVVRADGTTLIVNAPEEKHFKQASVTTDAKTQVTFDGKPATLSDLKPGDRVIVSPPTGTAKAIDDKAPRKTRPPESGQVEGAVLSATADQLIFRGATSGGEIVDIKTATTAKASVSINGKAAKLADLKPGQYVLVVFFGGDVRRVVVNDQPG